MKTTLKKSLLCVLVVIFIVICAFSASAADEHHWSEWIIDKAPTCTETGHRYRVCDADMSYIHKEDEILPKVSHDYILIETQPNCQAVGTRTYKCKNCGYTYTESFGAKTAHTYIEAVTKKPTCTDSGVKVFTCSVCGESYTEAIPKTEHSYQEQITAQPDCTQAGEKTFTCSVCGVSYTEAFGEKTEHSFEKITEEQGGSAVTLMKCTVCGYSYELERTALKQPIDFITAANITLGTANIALLLLFGLMLYPDFKVLCWYKKRKKRRKAELNSERSQ